MKFLVTKELLFDVYTILAPTKKRKDFTFHYLYIVHTIRHSQVFNQNSDSSTFINLHSELLGKTISKLQTPTILKTLIKNNIIESDGVYIPGRKSFGYRVTGHYLSQKWHYTDVKDAELIGKISAITEKHSKDIRSKGIGYQTAAYWAKEIAINKRNALFYVNNPKNNFSDVQKTHYKISIESVDNKQFFTSFSSTNRLYTNLTCIKSGLRQHLTIDKQPLYAVDITSSQPLFLGLLMRNNNNVDQEEVENYLKIVCSGLFYEYIAERAGLNIDDKEVRNKFKQKIFSGCLFDHTRDKYSKLEIIFHESFPTILSECRNMKRGDHKILSRQLQKMEAKFIFHCVELSAKAIGDVPLSTIHDAIVSTEENIYMVEQIVVAEFVKLKIYPKIKIEKL
jgi:hypothetical protein